MNWSRCIQSLMGGGSGFGWTGGPDCILGGPTSLWGVAKASQGLQNVLQMISKKCSCSKRMPGECWGFRGPLVFSQGPRWVRGHPLYPPLLNSGCVYRELVALTLCQLPAYIYEPNLYPTVYMYIVYIIYHTLNKPIHTGCPIHYVQFLIAYL